MAVIESSGVVVLTLLCTLPMLLSQHDYKIPEASVVALKPRGLAISLPGDPKLSVFMIEGHIVRPSENSDIATILNYVSSPTNGFWTYRNDVVKLEIGDVIHYSIQIVREGDLLIREHLNYTVTELIDSKEWKRPSFTKNNKTTKRPVSTSSKHVVPVTRKPIPATTRPPVSTTTEPAVKQTAQCRPTSTSVLWPDFMKTIICSGQIIFEDNFDTLYEDLWTVEEYIPSKPEYPFVSYQRTTVSVENGTLRIQPQLQENLPGFDSTAITYSTLDLSSGCTRPGSCVISSDGGHILPPIASGRITSKTFSFKYGSIEVRAKVPQGDWLYPDILLESIFKKYGMDDYASGILTIADVLGNIILKNGTEEYGNKVLSGGPVMDFKCRSNLLAKKISSTEWGNDFHVYSLRWTQDTITLSVDGEEWGTIEAPIDGLQSRLPRDTCGLLHRTFLKTPMAPFDDYFNIILGVSAGGVSKFPDGVVSLYTRPKPWMNTARRARLDFFTAKDNWLPTWTQPALLVDYIRVRAL